MLSSGLGIVLDKYTLSQAHTHCHGMDQACKMINPSSSFGPVRSKVTLAISFSRFTFRAKHSIVWGHIKGLLVSVRVKVQGVEAF